MKKTLKLIISIIVGILLLVIVDIVFIYTNNKPLIVLSENNNKYQGIFYDTYNCPEFPAPQIKAKWTKFTCHTNNKDSVIMGKIKEIKNNYIIITGISDENQLKQDNEAHIELNNNPTIKGSSNLIIGQTIKLNPITIKEVYPMIITTNEIEVVYSGSLGSKVVGIIDKSEMIEEFNCSEALEEIYRDQENIYYFSCIKSSYVMVKYENNYQEPIKDALKYGSITIQDLDKYDIEYVKEPIK